MTTRPKSPAEKSPDHTTITKLKHAVARHIYKNWSNIEGDGVNKVILRVVSLTPLLEELCAIRGKAEQLISKVDPEEFARLRGFLESLNSDIDQLSISQAILPVAGQHEFRFKCLEDKEISIAVCFVLSATDDDDPEESFF